MKRYSFRRDPACEQSSIEQEADALIGGTCLARVDRLLQNKWQAVAGNADVVEPSHLNVIIDYASSLMPSENVVEKSFLQTFIDDQAASLRAWFPDAQSSDIDVSLDTGLVSNAATSCMST